MFKYPNKARCVKLAPYLNVTFWVVLGDQQKPKNGIKCKNHRIILNISY